MIPWPDLYRIARIRAIQLSARWRLTRDQRDDMHHAILIALAEQWPSIAGEEPPLGLAYYLSGRFGTAWMRRSLRVVPTPPGKPLSQICEVGRWMGQGGEDAYFWAVIETELDRLPAGYECVRDYLDGRPTAQICERRGMTRRMFYRRIRNAPMVLEESARPKQPRTPPSRLEIVRRQREKVYALLQTRKRKTHEAHDARSAGRFGLGSEYAAAA